MWKQLNAYCSKSALCRIVSAKATHGSAGDCPQGLWGVRRFTFDLGTLDSNSLLAKLMHLKVRYNFNAVYSTCKET